MSKTVIGVMGPGEGASPSDKEIAHQVGAAIAEQGWVLLTGGRNVGVMEAANCGAKTKGGLTIGILPGAEHSNLSTHVDIPIVTDMGSGRNNINILSSHVIVACGLGAGTTSEIALAIKAGTPVILMNMEDIALQFFHWLAPQEILIAASPMQAVEQVQYLLTTARNCE